MLPFFRKIRWRLARDNQFFKYSRYAIGEIVLVVIGILIALQINNWNEDKVRDDNLRIYMNNMIRDLNSDIRSLAINGNINRFRFNSLQHILVLSGQEPTREGYSLTLPQFEGFRPWEKNIPKDFDPEFVTTAFAWTLPFGDMSPNLSTMNELQNNGLFSYIKSNELKASIYEYYDEYYRRLGPDEEKNIKKYRDDWLDSLTQNGFNAEEITDLEGALVWLGSDPTATARLKNIIFNAKWRYESADALIERANKLIELINQNELMDQK